MSSSSAGGGAAHTVDVLALFIDFLRVVICLVRLPDVAIYPETRSVRPSDVRAFVLDEDVVVEVGEEHQVVRDGEDAWKVIFCNSFHVFMLFL